MDPDVTLRDIDELLTNRPVPTPIQDEAISEHLSQSCRALSDWLDSGGYHPDWQAYPKATKYFQSLDECPTCGQAGSHDPGCDESVSGRFPELQ